MPKRWHLENGTSTGEPSQKKTKQNVKQVDQLSSLSDEVLLLILNFLPIRSLLTCQRVSSRLRDLSGDSELWKRRYYSQWVWPRTHRARRIKQNGENSRERSEGLCPPKGSNWFDQSPLKKVEGSVNWKGEYRLQHNWSNGSCQVTEVELVGKPLTKVVTKLDRGIVFTADPVSGLRAWSLGDTKKCLATLSPRQMANGNRYKFGAPTTITVASHEQNGVIFDITVGFELGSFAVYSFNQLNNVPQFKYRFEQTHKIDIAITAAASEKNYLFLMDQSRDLALYRIDDGEHITSAKLLSSLTSINAGAPFSLSVRTTPTHVIAAVAYSFYRIGMGCPFGIQELSWSVTNNCLSSRVATSVDCQMLSYSAQPQPLVGNNKYNKSSLFPEQRGTLSARAPCPMFSCSPSSLSYSHPYLLASHPDNTLTVYLVSSTTDRLVFQEGHRLWGHTAAVSSVQVNNRGKAVSLSYNSHEIRVWELENTTSTRLMPKRTLGGEYRIQIAPADVVVIEPKRPITNYMDWWLPSACIEGSVQFDDHQVVIQQHKRAGTQLMDVYDFT